MSTVGEVGDGGGQTLVVFSGRDCSQPISYSRSWNCLTDIPGVCNTVPYNVKSFYIAKGPIKNGKCTMPKSVGGLSGIGQRGMGMVAAGVATLVSAMLML